MTDAVVTSSSAEIVTQPPNSALVTTAVSEVLADPFTRATVSNSVIEIIVPVAGWTAPITNSGAALLIGW